MNRLAAALLLALALSGCATWRNFVGSPAKSAATAPADGLFAEITTPRGTLTCELFFAQAPLTVASFVGLAEGTLGPAPRKPYFEGLTFHRIVPGFVIQGGDPTGTGSGGPGYDFPNEFFPGPLQRHAAAGVLSMANAGPDTNGSQFFITLGAARYLDYVHPIFGRVIAGADVPAKIEQGDTMSVKIIRRGRAAERFRPDEKNFAALRAAAKGYPTPHVADDSPAAPSDLPFQTRYLEIRLTELALFGGRHIYVQLESKFSAEPDTPTEQSYADSRRTRLHLPPGAIVAVFFTEPDRWYFSGAPAGFTLPSLAAKPPPKTPPVSPEALKRRRQSEIYFAAEQVVSALIDQTDPK